MPRRTEKLKPSGVQQFRTGSLETNITTSKLPGKLYQAGFAFWGNPRLNPTLCYRRLQFEHTAPAFPPLDTAEDKLISALHTLDEPNPGYQHVATTNRNLHIIAFAELLAYSCIFLHIPTL